MHLQRAPHHVSVWVTPLWSCQSSLAATANILAALLVASRVARMHLNPGRSESTALKSPSGQRTACMFISRLCSPAFMLRSMQSCGGLGTAAAVDASWAWPQSKICLLEHLCLVITLPPLSDTIHTTHGSVYLRGRSTSPIELLFSWTAACADGSGPDWQSFLLLGSCPSHSPVNTTAHFISRSQAKKLLIV